MVIYKIYIIENLINGKKYVGKTSKTLEFRFKKHIKNAKKKINRRLYDSMNYHGYDNFKITLIDEAPTNDEANILEIYYISKLETINPIYGYNMTKGGDGGDTGKYYYGKSPYDWWVEKYGKEIADDMKESARQKASEANRGRIIIISDETRKNISKNMKEKFKNGELKPNLPPPKYGSEHHNYKYVDLQKVEELLKNNKSLCCISETLGYTSYAIRQRFFEKNKITIYEFQKNIKQNYMSEDDIVNYITSVLKSDFIKKISEICNDIKIKECTARRIFKKKMNMTFEDYRTNIVGSPLNNYPRKLFLLKISDIDECFDKGITKIKDVSKKLNVSTDLIQTKIEKEKNINFTQYRQQYYERN